MDAINASHVDCWPVAAAAAQSMAGKPRFPRARIRGVAVARSTSHRVKTVTVMPGLPGPRNCTSRRRKRLGKRDTGLKGFVQLQDRGRTPCRLVQEERPVQLNWPSMMLDDSTSRAVRGPTRGGFGTAPAATIMRAAARSSSGHRGPRAQRRNAGGQANAPIGVSRIPVARMLVSRLRAVRSSNPGVSAQLLQSARRAARAA